MSVAKPTLDYVRTIPTTAEFSKTITAFKRLLRYHRPHALFFASIVGLSAAKSYFFTLEPLYTAEIIDQVITQGNYSLLAPLILDIVIVVSLYALLNYLVTYSQAYTAQKIERKIRSDYYASLQEKPFKFYDSTQVGDLVSRATMDLQMLEMFLNTWVGTITSAIFTTAFMLYIMYTINPVMTLIAFIPMVFTFYFNAKLFTLTMPLFRKMQLTLGKLGSYIQQDILGMKVVRIFRRESELEDGFKQVESLYVETAVNAGRIQSKYMPSAPTILTLGITMLYLYGGHLIASPGNVLTIGDLTLFARYMLRLAQPLRDTSMLIGLWINASAGLERVHTVMDSPREVEDRFDAKDLVISKGRVEFENVTFGYVKNRPVLRNVSFMTNPGERIAILGATGSGKTSLVYLIPRFYDVDSGRILIDDVKIDQYRLASLRRQIGIVMQDVFIFSGTVADNIAFGKPEASKDEIIEAAKLARLHDFITSLPDGYQTLIGERGINLSGGQRQRLTIARALLTDPRILILDDSLSFVDANTEKEIQIAIEDAMEGRTCFIIAQRLSTIKNADRIMVLDDGKIIEFGTHTELLARDGVYRRIYETQFLQTAPESVPKIQVK
ncbi:MAG: ABC transporter ATP-binding protein [Candidatus Bathyarchaeia archaeon]|jgi:ABC-type multidrug transport system fused ATPase/permease subunit